MKSKRFVSAVCIALILAAACNKKAAELAIYIPKDASVVFVIDAKAITDKINSSGVNMDTLIKLFSDKDAHVKANWSDIKNSGIDLNKSLYFFERQSNSMQHGSLQSAALIAAINDDKKIEAFLEKQKPNSKISSGNGYKYMLLNNNSVAGWTSKALIISSANQNENNNSESAKPQQQLQIMFNQKEYSSIAYLN